MTALSWGFQKTFHLQNELKGVMGCVSQVAVGRASWSKLGPLVSMFKLSRTSVVSPGSPSCWLRQPPYPPWMVLTEPHLRQCSKNLYHSGILIWGQLPQILILSFSDKLDSVVITDMPSQRENHVFQAGLCHFKQQRGENEHFSTLKYKIHVTGKTTLHTQSKTWLETLSLSSSLIPAKPVLPQLAHSTANFEVFTTWKNNWGLLSVNASFKMACMQYVCLFNHVSHFAFPSAIFNGRLLSNSNKYEYIQCICIFFLNRWSNRLLTCH